jgi:PAS domain S-box-containing protein
MKFPHFYQSKIQDKIAWLSIIQFVVVVLFIGFILNAFISRIINQEIKNNLSAITQSRASHIETYFRDSVQLLQLVTSRTAMRKSLAEYNKTGQAASLENITGIIKDAITPIPQFERICVIGLSGEVLTSTNENYCGKKVKTAPFFINGLKEEGVYFLQEEGVYKVYISGPMKLDGQTIGVGMTVLNLDYLRNIVRDRTGLGETGEVLIAFNNEAGERVYPLGKLFEDDAVALAEENEKTAYPMRSSLSGEGGYFEDTLDYRNERVVAVSEFIEMANLGLVTKIDRDEVFENSKQLFLLFVSVFVIFVLLYYFFSKKVAHFISKPIIDLQRGTEEIERGNLDYSVGTQIQDEIGQLSRSFDSMVESLKKSKAEVDKKVKEQTTEIEEKSKNLEEQKLAILNVLEDVEEEKIKTERLANDLEKFKLAVENASDQIVITDPEGIVVYGNKALTRITGYTPQEAFGKKAAVLWRVPMSREYYEHLWDVIKNQKKLFIGEIQNRRKNGELYIANISISPVLDKTGNVIYFVAIEHDITKEKEIDKAKTEFVSLASHQLRTPLSSINWYTEMLLAGDAGKLKEEQKKYLSEVAAGSQRMVDLVNALLNVSRLDLGTLMIEPESVDVPSISRSVVLELKPQVIEKKIKISESYDKDLVEYSADKKLLRIVFQNLLSNAVKYTPKKGLVKVEVGQKTKGQAFGDRKLDGDFLTILVEDHGMGIPVRQQDKIFTKMFRADNARESETEGTGLGLYIIKSIINQSGGHVWFQSEEGQGTTFYVILPLSGMKKKSGTKQLD